MLTERGLTVVDLPGETVLRAQVILHERPHPSIHDGFAFALAESRDNCGLLTGDGGLRDLAVDRGMKVHGMLWLIDEIHEEGLASAEELLGVLHRFADDPTVRLPRRELSRWIRRYETESR